jgi:hypothetical protein
MMGLLLEAKEKASSKFIFFSCIRKAITQEADLETPA